MLLLWTGVYPLHIYSDDGRVTTTATIYVYSCCYRYCYCSFSCWRCTRPTWQRQRRVSHDDGVPHGTLPVVISSHSPYIRFAIFRRNSVTDYSAATSTVDKVLPSSLVSDRVNAVYSFISANPFDDYIPSPLSHHRLCLSSSFATTIPTIPPTVYFLRGYSVGRILRTAKRHGDDYILFLKTITQTCKRSNTTKPANIRISIP